MFLFSNNTIMETKEPYTLEDWTIVYRQRTECYSRVMWYFRPVSQYNNWKKSEFYSRVNFKEPDTENKIFTAKFI